jgi:hypothetical protein
VPFFVYPLIVLGVLLLVVLLFAVLARVRGGKYLRPIVATLAKVPLIRKLMTKASAAALERQNPDLASALKKLEGATPNMPPQQAQKLFSRLTPAERDAYMELVGEQAGSPDSIANRAERRRLEKMQQPARKKSGNNSSNRPGASGRRSGGGKRKRG